MRIIWLKKAVIDLQSIWEYITLDNPKAARQIAQTIKAKTKSLQKNPALGRPGRIPETRELIITGTPFILPYRVRDNHIEILRVIHGARRWPQNL